MQYVVYYAGGMRVVCWLMGMDAMGVLGGIMEGWMLVWCWGFLLSDLAAMEVGFVLVCFWLVCFVAWLWEAGERRRRYCGGESSGRDLVDLI